MRAILINPVAKVVTEVEYNGNYTQIYEFIHCSCFCTAGNLPNGDTMFVDDEGLFDQKYGFFKWKGYPTPLVGYGLLMGGDRAGETCEVKSKIEDLDVEFGVVGRIGKNIAWMTDVGHLSIIPE